MSRECEKCDEHTLECICREMNKSMIANFKNQNAFLNKHFPNFSSNDCEEDKCNADFDMCDEHTLDCVCDKYVCPEPIRSYDLPKINQWIKKEDELPPKGIRFLVSTPYGVEIMEYKNGNVDGYDKEWIGSYCSCNCCSGYCTGSFTHWMPLPLPPKE